MFTYFKNTKVRQYLVILTGLSLAWISPMLSKLKEADGTGMRTVTDEEASWIASGGLLLGLPLHLTIGPIMDRIGRKTCLVIASIPRFVACLILIFASEIWLIIVARAIIDMFTIGVVVGLTATYATEMASKEIRGALGTTIQVASTLGMLILFGLAPFLSYFHVNLLYTCCVAAISVSTWFLPESPYYLYSQGRKEESFEILIKYRESKTLVLEEIKDYESSLKENASRPSIRETFSDAITLKTLCKVMFLGLLFETAGYNSTMYFMMEILKSTKTVVSSNIASLANGCIQLVASFFTIMLTDRFGRKPILIGTLFGMAIGMIGLATFFQLQSQGYEITGILNYLPLLSMMLVMFCFSAGLGSLCWTFIAELFEGPARAASLSLTIFISIIILFILTKYFTAVVNVFGAAIVYWFFSLNCIFCAFYVLFAFPETKGKSFSDIQRNLGRKIERNIKTAL